MKIGVVVYSQTGNTYSVANRLYQRLRDDGHNVEINQIEVIRDMTGDKKIKEITKSPNASKYDFIILGSPVEAFALCPVMKTYLNDIKSLNKKKVICFVTQFFPFPWMGGNNAIKQMKTICQDKGATILNTGIVNWSNKKREVMIKDIIDSISNCLKGAK